MEASQQRQTVSGELAGGQHSRPSSQQTSSMRSRGGDAPGDFISHQKHRVKLQADPAATQGQDASLSTCQYVNVYLFPHVGAVFLRNKGSEEEGTKVFPEVFFQYCVDVPVSP